MFLRLALALGFASQLLLASDLTPKLLPGQSVGPLQELTRQALDRQIRSFLLKEPQPPAKNPFSSLPQNPQLNKRAEVRLESGCSIPLEQLKVDNTQQYAIKSMKLPKLDFNAITKAPPVPACKR